MESGLSLWSTYNTRDLLWLGDWGTGWIVGLLLLGALILGVSAYDLWSMPKRRRFSLLALRATIYALAVLMLLEPALDLKHVSKVKNHVALLIDKSRSMELGSDDPKISRHERVNAAIKEQLPELKRALEDEHELHVFSFGQELKPAPGDAAMGPPIEPSTDLSGALEALKTQLAGKELGGVIVLSDGIDTGALGKRTKRGESLDATSLALLKGLGAPMTTYSAARSGALKDLAITRVLHDDFAFVHNKVSVEVELAAIGIEPGVIEVTLRRDGELLQTRQLQIKPEQTSYKLTFEFVPKRIGKEIYTVNAPHLANEALLENNQQAFLLKVIRDKVRALQVVGRPSWDERFLRRLLKRNPNVDLISFFILRTPANVQRVPPDELSLIPFPTQELFEQELGSFDLIIFQNFNFGPYNMRQYLPRIAQFVKDGGGFVMVGGELSFGSGGYARTAIEDILPIKLPAQSSTTLVDDQPFNPKLTEAGLHHPITQLAFDPQTNREIWAKLPAQQGTNLVAGPSKDATVLATHPKLRVGGQAMPVLSVSEMEKGRVMALTTDSSWRWGFEALGKGGTPREYQLFWNNAIRWLIKDPELKLLKIELPQDTHSPGQRASIVVRVAKPDYTPAAGAKGTIKILRRSLEALGAEGEAPRQEVKTLSFETDATGQAQLELGLEKTGAYDLIAQSKTASGELEDTNTLLVIPNVPEHRDIIPREELLAQLAQATGGKALDLPTHKLTEAIALEPQAVTVNKRRVIQLWDSLWTFIMILSLLGIEWSLRRRWGRL